MVYVIADRQADRDVYPVRPRCARPAETSRVVENMRCKAERRELSFESLDFRQTDCKPRRVDGEGDQAMPDRGRTRQARHERACPRRVAATGATVQLAP